MMKKRSFFVVLVLSLVMILSAIPAYGAQVNSSKLTNNQISELRARFSSEGLSKDTQDSLIQKITNGQLIDSNNPEKLKTIPKEFFSLSKTNTEKKYVFPDGSYVKVSAIEITPANEQELLDAIGDQTVVNELIQNQKQTVQATAVQATVPTGYYEYNTWIEYDFTQTGGGFECDFTTTDSNPSLYPVSDINSVSSPLAWAVAGTSNNPQVSIVHSFGTGTTPAQAQMLWQFIAIGGAASFNYGFTFNVAQGNWWCS